MPRRVRTPPAWLLAALLAAVYLVVDPFSADLAAQTYRTQLFEHAGFVLWDNGWYGGHHVPAYSILFPPLAAWTSPQLVGAVAAVVATWAFERLARGLAGAAGGRPAGPATYWFATTTMVSLVSGRLTFALGLAFGLLAVLALARRRLVLCALAGAGAALSSPVAAAFLALALAAWGLAGERSVRRLLRTAALLAATLAPALVLSILFPEGGDFPFTASAFWPTLAGTLLLLAVLWRTAAPALRLGIVLYALLIALSGALSTPMGGNAVRLGSLLAGPLAALVLWPDRRRALALLALPMLYWQLGTPVDDVRRAAQDPSVHAAFYDGMLTFLRAQPGGPFRIEIPFTDNHWESARVAPSFPLARGWERQLDRKLNGLFYDGAPLTPARYQRWLHDNAVRYVALPDAPIDYSAAAEAKLVRDGDVPDLREVFHDAHWRVFAVTDATPLAGGGARVTALGADTIGLDVPRRGSYLVRVRFTPYWRVQAKGGCVRPDGGWIRVRAPAPGPLRIGARFSLGRVRATGEVCTDAGG